MFNVYGTGIDGMVKSAMEEKLSIPNELLSSIVP
jgi:hypothetical protein